MTDYIIGFLFNQAGDEVALIQKNKPEWQKGKLNGIGGKLEEGEEPLQAIDREFTEEAGVSGLDWKFRFKLSGPDFNMHIYSCFSDRMNEVRTMEEEKVGTYLVGAVTLSGAVSNLQWMVPLLQERNLEISDMVYH
jgi:8-oxo-dGTP diphosphatase